MKSNLHILSNVKLTFSCLKEEKEVHNIWITDVGYLKLAIYFWLLQAIMDV